VAITARRDITPDHFRNVLGHFPTGVAGITSIGRDGAPVGMTVGSFASVSLDPPLVAFMPAKGSSTFPKIREAGFFCVNVLGADQEDVCRAFAARGTDRFAGLRWHPAQSGAPVLDGAIAWIDCDIESVTEAGDHHIVLGRVRDLATAQSGLPLLFFQRGYGQFSSLSLTAAPEPDLIEKLRLADIVRPHMERLVVDLDAACMSSALIGSEVVVLASTGIPVDREFPTRVGQRMPFVAPLGAIFAAWSEALLRRWTQPLTQASPEQLEQYSQMCRRVRERGWSIAMTSEAHRRFENALTGVSVSEIATQDLEPVRRVIGALAEAYDPAMLDAEREYCVRNISVPVFDSETEPLLALTLYGLPPSISRAQIDAYVEVLTEASTAISREL
jgi:flavin reductase (DIM6/NTAB) family NADH-FMN oxidoreductase RutF/DNA-binding IclR family transcriptional regulator